MKDYKKLEDKICFYILPSVLQAMYKEAINGNVQELNQAIKFVEDIRENYIIND